MATLPPYKLRRQDFVDNAVFDLIKKVNTTCQNIPWNIEDIGRIRDVLVTVLTKTTRVPESEIYP